MAKTLLIKVREKGRKEDCQYKNEININDPNLIALILLDLREMFNAPIDKAYSLISSKRNIFPL